MSVAFDSVSVFLKIPGSIIAGTRRVCRWAKATHKYVVGYLQEPCSSCHLFILRRLPLETFRDSNHRLTLSLFSHPERMSRDCKKFVCPDCDKKFKYYSEFNVHRRIHTGEKPFACPDCDKKFTQSGDLKVHRRIHTSEKPFACPDCDMTFITNSNLNVHRRIHTGEKPFACPDCDKNFTRIDELKVHRRIHTSEKPFACPDCDKKFTQSGDLKVHRRIHTGEKPFACPDCNKKFTHSGDLKVHRRIHTGEKPFVCPDCDMTFTTNGNFNVHRRIHTGEKPFVCLDCNKQFKDSSHLKTHCRIHTGEKSFCYSEHNNEFIRHRKTQTGEQQISSILCSPIVDLNEQQVLHKPEKLFVCHVCEEPFSEESLLENHVKIHPDAEDFLCERNFSNFIEQRKLYLGPQMPVHTDDLSIVPSECNMVCSASSGNCVLDGKVDDGDVHMSADKLLDSSTSCSGNEESSTEKKDTDSFKLYGCGICCQSFSTKE